MSNEEIVKEIILLLNSSIKEKDLGLALNQVEKSKKLQQDLYYSLWLNYHKSGTHK